MKRGPRLALIALAVAVLSACGGSQPAPEDKEAAKAHGRDTDATVFDDMIQTEDKARAVEGVTMQQKANMDAAIDKATSGDAGTTDDQ